MQGDVINAIKLIDEYTYIKARIIVAQEDIQLCKAQLQISAAISKYNAIGSRGFSDLNQIEQSGEKNIKLATKIARNKATMKKLKTEIVPIQKAIDMLDKLEKALLLGFYVNKLSYEEIACLSGQKEKDVQKNVRIALLQFYSNYKAISNTDSK